ncbi:phospholipase D/Transphosphatidylase [Parasphaerochaeta coccoides DSM 17374]|uniref:Phospholipase D/Transphosphatidylase n=2 Tax=Parasphaerochaeta TaxID=3062336 RepID=F4GKA5_PARC1|nr:phospholipase D/Transphosphatidylase [Parasphaerochaeta coccoides DSM 17374]
MKTRLSVFLILFLLGVTGCSTTRMMTDPVLTGQGAGIEEKLEGLRLPSAHSMRPVIYTSGPQWFERQLELIEASQEHIVMTTFLASQTDSNEALYEALARKADEGVDVWLLYDGSSYMENTAGRSFIRSLRWLEEHGVKLFEFNPLTVSRLPSTLRLIIRDHRKLFISDGLTVVVGGMNMNHMSLASDQHDLMFEFTSSGLASLALEVFRKDWNALSWDTIPEGRFAGFQPSGFQTPIMGHDAHEMTVWLANQSLDGNPVMASVFAVLFSGAKESILLTPLFPILDGNMRRLVADAVNRGVRVVIVPPYDGVDINRNATEYAVADLIAAGAEVYMQTEDAEGRFPAMLHDKLMIIDGRYVLVGSTNFNFRSMNFSKEISILIKDDVFGQEMSDYFQNIIARSRRITADEAGEWRTFKNWLMHLVSYITA